MLFCRRLLRRPLEREDAGDGGSAAHGRIELHRTTMQLDEGTHDRKSEAGPAMFRAHRVAFKAIKHALADLGRDARTAVGYVEDHRAVAPLDRQAHYLARWREADRVGEEIEQDLSYAPRVGEEAADIGRGAHVEQHRL